MYNENVDDLSGVAAVFIGDPSLDVVGEQVRTLHCEAIKAIRAKFGDLPHTRLYTQCGLKWTIKLDGRDVWHTWTENGKVKSDWLVSV